MESPNKLFKEETYIGLYPLDGYLAVREYGVVSEQAPSEAEEHAAALKESVEGLRYAKSEFEFRLFESQEERFCAKSAGVTGAFDLTTSERNLKKLIEDSFGAVLRRPVNIVIDEDKVRVSFNASGLLVDRSFCESGSIKGDTVTLVYANGQTGEVKYEILFSPRKKKKGTSLKEFFPECDEVAEE